MQRWGWNWRPFAALARIPNLPFSQNDLCPEFWPYLLGFLEHTAHFSQYAFYLSLHGKRLSSFLFILINYKRCSQNTCGWLLAEWTRGGKNTRRESGKAGARWDCWIMIHGQSTCGLGLTAGSSLEPTGQWAKRSAIHTILRACLSPSFLTSVQPPG